MERKVTAVLEQESRGSAFSDGARDLEELREKARAAGAEGKDLEKDLDAVERQVRELETALEAANKDLDRFKKEGKGVDQVRASFLSLKGAIAGLGVGLSVGAVTQTVAAVLDASGKQVQALAQVDAALKSTKGTASLTRREIEDMASAMQDVTTVADEVVLAGQAILLKYRNIGEEIFPRTTEAALDLATSLRQDLESSMKLIGAALDDPINGINALTDAGVNLTQQQKDQVLALQLSGNVLGAQKLILQELEAQYGGSARAARDTFVGAMDAASNSAGELLEIVGAGGLTAALRNVTEVFISSSGQMKGAAQDLGKVLGTVVLSGGAAVNGIKVAVRSVAQVVSETVSLTGRSLATMLEVASKAADAVGQDDAADRLKGQADRIRSVMSEFITSMRKESEDSIRNSREALGGQLDTLLDIWSGKVEKGGQDLRQKGQAMGRAVGEGAADGLSAGRKQVEEELKALLTGLDSTEEGILKRQDAFRRALESLVPDGRFDLLPDDAKERVLERLLEIIGAVNAAGVQLDPVVKAFAERLKIPTEGLNTTVAEVKAILADLRGGFDLTSDELKKKSAELKAALEEISKGGKDSQINFGLSEEGASKLKARLEELVEAHRQAGEKIDPVIGDAANKVGVLVGEYEIARAGASQLAGAQGDLAGAAVQVTQAVSDQGQAIKEVTTAQDAAAGATDQSATATGRQKDAATSVIEVLNRQGEKVREIAVAQADAASKTDDATSKSSAAAESRRAEGEAATAAAEGVGKLAAAQTEAAEAVPELSSQMAELLSSAEAVSKLDFSSMSTGLKAAESVDLSKVLADLQALTNLMPGLIGQARELTTEMNSLKSASNDFGGTP